MEKMLMNIETKVQSDKVEYVYKNWYLKSCKKSKESPVSLKVYSQIVTEPDVDALLKMLLDGKTP
jgi:hypothetical protein